MCFFEIYPGANRWLLFLKKKKKKTFLCVCDRTYVYECVHHFPIETGLFLVNFANAGMSEGKRPFSYSNDPHEGLRAFMRHARAPKAPRLRCVPSLRQKKVAGARARPEYENEARGVFPTTETPLSTRALTGSSQAERCSRRECAPFREAPDRTK